MVTGGYRPGKALEARSAGTVAPSEIAQALRYLIDAPSVTGQMIAVDAGQHMAGKP